MLIYFLFESSQVLHIGQFTKAKFLFDLMEREDFYLYLGD